MVAKESLWSRPAPFLPVAEVESLRGREKEEVAEERRKEEGRSFKLPNKKKSLKNELNRTEARSCSCNNPIFVQ